MILLIIKEFLLAEYKIVPEMHLKQSEFAYSACKLFTKNSERIKKFIGTGDSRYL